MFCDLVGSTLLASQLDPEDLSDVMRSYQSVVAVTVQQASGFVARFMGDGVLVYFGWPRADEANAERAVRAGLAVLDAVGRISAGGQRLHVRIGIATGLVVVGELLDTDVGHEHAVVGEAPNLAARLQAHAEADTIVIDQATRTRIGELFDCQDLGTLSVKGYAEPVRVWRVLGKGAVQSRFEALRASGLTRFVNREEEIELLLRRWNQVMQVGGRIVLITGEPGIGKSRLIAALQERLRSEEYACLRFSCAPHHQNEALHPIIAHLQHVASFKRDDTPEDKARKLRAVVSPGLPAEDVVMFAHLLSLPVQALPALDATPQRKKEKTFDALYRQMERLARQQRLLMVFEDVQWCDPTTIELFDRTLDRLLRLPVLVIMTFRPDWRAKWVGREEVSLLTLGRLDRSQSAALVQQLVSGNVFLGDMINRIVTETDGVPLFIEELTKVVAESVASTGAEGSAAGTALAVPATLQDSLMARLDRFPAAKMVAQIGSVIGRKFSHDLLRDVARMPEPVLLEGLEQLVAAELVFRSGVPPEADYTFKHALVQDAAYESLLRRKRSAIHARVVQVLLERSPDLRETQPGLVGHHCVQAGLIEQAASCYRLAGERSAERAALAETHNYLERGLALVRTLPDSAARRILEIELKLALGRVLLSTKGSADVEAGQIFEEVLALCFGLGRIDLHTRALWGCWFNKAHRRELAGAENAVHELLRLGPAAEPQCDPAVAHAMLGITRFWQGRFSEAQLSLQDAFARWRPDESNQLDLAIVSNHLDNHIRVQHCLALTCLGYLDRAAAEATLATQRALELAHLPTRAIVIAARCRHDYFVRDLGSLREMTTRLVTLAEEQAFPFYLAIGRCHLGWVAVKDGHVVEGLDLLQTGLNGLQATDAAIWQPIFRGIMGEAQFLAGNSSAAEHFIDEALAQSVETGSTWFSAELHRLKGEVRLMRPAPDPQLAQECFHQAITIAQSQSAKLWELRAATSLARLWSALGKRAEARDLLAPVHGWFAEGRNAPDIQDAAALLAELINCRAP